MDSNFALASSSALINLLVDSSRLASAAILADSILVSASVSAFNVLDDDANFADSTLALEAI